MKRSRALLPARFQRTTVVCRLGKGAFQTIKLLPLLLRELRFRCALGRRKFANLADLGLRRRLLRNFQQRRSIIGEANISGGLLGDRRNRGDRFRSTNIIARNADHLSSFGDSFVMRLMTAGVRISRGLFARFFAIRASDLARSRAVRSARSRFSASAKSAGQACHRASQSR